ncbi:MAG: type II toxin-antitoxin system HicA family toxin [Bacteroidota bacterium]|nr:type II toxin-antitoxin system HicA family toxin [Bacteroidota bacterium]
MPILGPIKRKDLIRLMRKLGFEGPFSGTKHQFMRKGNLTITIPNPHRSDIGISLVRKILRQAGITKDQWEKI